MANNIEVHEKYSKKKKKNLQILSLRSNLMKGF